MRKLAILAATTAIALGGVAAASNAEARDGRRGAAIAGGIIGLAAGAALAGSSGYGYASPYYGGGYGYAPGYAYGPSYGYAPAYSYGPAYAYGPRYHAQPRLRTQPVRRGGFEVGTASPRDRRHSWNVR